MGGRLQAKVALVTGGGVGIGAAIVRAFIAEGAKVLIAGRSQRRLEDFAATQPEESIAWHAGDITQLEDAKAMVDAAVERFGLLNVLVNNAAIDPAGTATDIAPELWQGILNTNLNGAFFLTRFAIPKMIEAGGGSIINISSLAGFRSIPAMPAYSTTKAGLLGLTQACALDYGSQGIRVNMISPGATATDMLKNQMKPLAEQQGTDVEGALNILTRFCPIARAGRPEEIAPAAVFFASDESSYITGQNLLIDGGASIVDPNGASTSSLGAGWGGKK
jgi:meso-butanediol dehydrogenase/(S,S)-butanediol dehydrogenase/diacetyl reductase